MSDPRTDSEIVDYVLNPFWEQKEIIELGRICESMILSDENYEAQSDAYIVMTAHRNTVEWTISAQRFPELLRLEQDKSMRLMVFCSDNQGPRPLKEVLFPHQAEIKVNGGEVKANLRGLKNKPGTTRPADITEHIRLKPPTYQNRVEFTYALTGKAGSSKPVSEHIQTPITDFPSALPTLPRRFTF